jgi:plastocyanin
MIFTRRDVAKRGVALVAVMALGAALVACGAPKPAGPKTYTVIVDQLAFSPQVTSARVGDTIVWINKDILRHTATAKDSSFDLDLDAGAQGVTVLKKAGTVQVYCRYHPGMTAQVMVSP